MKQVLKKALIPVFLISSIQTFPVAANDQLDNWVKKVHKAFAAKQRYPRAAIDKEIEGTVKIAIRVENNGSIVGFDIKKSSDHSILDNQVLSLLSRVNPLPALPEGSAKNEFVIPLAYRIAKGTEVNAEVNVDSDRVSMKDWSKAVKRRIARNQTYPTHLINEGVKGVTKIKLKIAADGAITSQEIVTSSGSPELDQETLELVGRINPLPALPDDRQQMTVTIPVSYKVSK